MQYTVNFYATSAFFLMTKFFSTMPPNFLNTFLLDNDPSLASYFINRISELLHSMQSCISDVKAWATANMIKLNDNKTELMLFTPKRTKHLHSLPTSITIGNAQIPFKSL